MTAGLNRSSLNTLTTAALDAAGLPVVPELKQQLQDQLAQKLLPQLETMISRPIEAFTAAALAQLSAQLSEQLKQTFQDASLAAIAELALPQNQTTPQAKAAARTLSPEVLSGMSEAPEETDATAGTPTAQFEPEQTAPATMTEPGSEAMTAGPGGSAPSGMPSTKPQQPSQPGGGKPSGTRRRGRRGQPSSTVSEDQSTGAGTTSVVGAPAAADATGTSSAAPEEGAIGQPEAPVEEGPVPDQTVDQYREQSVASALQREKNRRAQSGQANMSGQGEDAHQRGLNIIANEGAKVGNKLKNNIKNGGFGSFIICLALALTKDIIEPLALLYFDPGITGDVLSIFIGGLLTAVLLSEGTYFRRWLIKKFLGKAIIAFIAGLIPGLNVVFPEYTVGILLMGYDNFKDMQRLTKALAAHNELMKKISHLARQRPKAGPRSLAKVRQQLALHRQSADE
ncbi:MAG: hypothetical protein HY565_02760 [Candidatus Kerfeldbacteria bacterium]|nr:hypothetical protein [Candidatus Kerfeldbacteria bacterium]